MAWVRAGTISGTSWGVESWQTKPTWSGVRPLSVETRLNHIFPQVDTESHVPFIWQVQTEFPFFVATGDKVYIRSSITESIP